MELPPASQAKEEQYQQLEDTYAAPNAPEKPDVLTVVELEKSNQSSPSGDPVEETMVDGTSPTISSE